jgi:hypothetical protein
MRPSVSPLTPQNRQNTLTGIATCEQRYRQRNGWQETEDRVEHDEQTLLHRHRQGSSYSSSPSSSSERVSSSIAGDRLAWSERVFSLEGQLDL